MTCLPHQTRALAEAQEDRERVALRAQRERVARQIREEEQHRQHQEAVTKEET